MLKSSNVDGNGLLLTLDDYLNGLKAIGPSYSGPASNGGIMVNHISGKSVQEKTNGYQLFDVNRIAPFDQSGINCTNNGDGSFTFSSGEIPSYIDKRYTYSNAEFKKIFKVGNLYLTGGPTSGYNKLYLEVAIKNSTLGNIYLRSGSSKSIPQNYYDSSLTTIDIYLYAPSGSAVVGGTFKPMLYQDGDGAWEPFTGGLPAPNPDYPMEIKSFEVEKFISEGKNLLDYSSKYGTSETVGGLTVTFLHDGGIRINGTPTADFIYPVLCVRDFGNTSLNSANPSAISNEDGYCVSILPATPGIGCGYNKTNKTASLLINKGILPTVNNIVAYPQIEFGQTPTAFQKPFKDKILSSLILRSLPDGTKDEYLGNGKILRRVGYVEFEGASDEAWTSTAAAGYGKFNIEIPNAPVIDGEFGNRLMVNRFKFDNSQGWTTPRGNSLILGLSAYEGRIGFTLHGVETLADWKTWLSTHPIKLVYLLKNSIIETITPLLLESQNPKAYCYTNSEVDTDIEWQILPEGSLLPAVKALRQRVEELESEAIS